MERRVVVCHCGRSHELFLIEVKGVTKYFKKY